MYSEAATEFAISLVQTLVIHEPGVSSLELYNVIDALGKVCSFVCRLWIWITASMLIILKPMIYLIQLAQRPGSPESLQQLVEIARNNTANATSLTGFTANKEDKARQSRDKKVGYPSPLPFTLILPLFLHVNIMHVSFL